MENNIDKIFKNKLATHQEKPSDEAWAKLEQAMYGKQIKRKSMVAYWQIAAAVALLLTASFFYLDNDESKENLSVGTVKLPPQQTEVQIDEQKQNEAIAIETYQPTEKVAKQKNNAQVTHTKVKDVMIKESKIEKEEILLTNVEKVELTTEVKTAQADTQELSTANAEQTQTVKQNNPTAQDEEMRVTVKFVEEENLAEAEETKSEKKTWFGKMVSNIKKKRQKEKEETKTEEDNEREKSGVFVFGIDTDKIFAKKKSGE